MEVLSQAKLDLRNTLNLANQELQNLVSSEKLDKIQIAGARPVLKQQFEQTVPPRSSHSYLKKSIGISRRRLWVGERPPCLWYTRMNAGKARQAK